MLLCPPQHGKSHIASKRYPAYSLGLDPTHDIISASATAMLAEEFGREVRNTVASRGYAHLFPQTRLAEDSQARGRWSTQQGGSYYATGIGGALMGRGATRLIVDDPFASMLEAQSQLVRDKAWDWYRGTAYNRVRPGGAIVLIQHRMHEDDLAGRLIGQQACGGDRWEIVELPALSAGEAAWPERYDLEALTRIRANMAPRDWSSLYQQNPIPDDGTFFLRDWFEFVDPKKVPHGHKYTTGDFAVTEGGGDFTELGTHVYSSDTLYLALEGWRGQTSADTWIETLIDQFMRHKPLCFYGESGPIRRSIEPFLTRRMRERRGFCRLEWIVRSHDKATMARPLQAMAAAGKVKIVDSEYGHHLLQQLLQFPAGRLDDGVDMAALMALAIDQAGPGFVKPTEPQKKRDRWDDDEGSSSWKVA